MNAEINRFDASKRLFFMIDLYVPKKRMEESIERVKLEDIVKTWTEKTSVLVVTIEGYMGRGKTDFSLKLSEALLRAGAVQHIISNIEVYKDERDYLLFASKYHKITKLSELIELLYLLRKEGKVLILDEGALHLLHRRSGSSKAVILIKLLVLFRKLKTHVIIAIQNRDILDKVFRDVVSREGVHIEKISKEEAIIYDAIQTKKYKLIDIKPTLIPFNSDYLAPFVVDIDESVLDDILMLLDDQTTTIDRLKRLLYARDGVHALSEIELQFYEFMLQNREFTTKDVSIALNIAKRTAQKYVQMLRDEQIVEMIGQGSRVYYRLTKEGEELIKKRLEWARSHVSVAEEVV